MLTNWVILLRARYKYNHDVKEVDWEVVDWINVVQNKDNCRAVHNTDVDCRVTWNAAIFWVDEKMPDFQEERYCFRLVSEWVN